MELKLKGISKAYGKKLAVDDFSVTLTQGVYGLLGANGAGKSTLMRIICDIMRPTRGEILLDGCSIKELGEDYRNLLGYLPQDFGYYPSFSGEKFLLYMASLKGLDRKSAGARGKELLELVGLSQVKNKKISSYSGGMKQRLGIAQALLNDPKILVLDDPKGSHMKQCKWVQRGND